MPSIVPSHSLFSKFPLTSVYLVLKFFKRLLFLTSRLHGQLMLNSLIWLP